MLGNNVLYHIYSKVNKLVDIWFSVKLFTFSHLTLIKCTIGSSNFFCLFNQVLLPCTVINTWDVALMTWQIVTLSHIFQHGAYRQVAINRKWVRISKVCLNHFIFIVVYGHGSAIQVNIIHCISLSLYI